MPKPSRPKKQQQPLIETSDNKTTLTSSFPSSSSSLFRTGEKRGYP